MKLIKNVPTFDGWIELREDDEDEQFEVHEKTLNLCDAALDMALQESGGAVNFHFPYCYFPDDGERPAQPLPSDPLTLRVSIGWLTDEADPDDELLYEGNIREQLLSGIELTENVEGYRLIAKEMKTLALQIEQRCDELEKEWTLKT